MSLPVLQNSAEYIQALRRGEALEPDVQWIESAVDVTEGNLRVLETHLRDEMKSVKRAGKNPIQFDSAAPAILHRDLRLDARSAAEKDFWAYLCAVCLEDIVRWRWQRGDAPPPANRFGGGWKDTFRRLWYRADLAYDPSLPDPYKYSRLGGEDFWVGLLERELSGCRALAKQLLPYWLDTAEEERRTMHDHRRFFTALVLLRPSCAFETLDAPSTKTLFERAARLAELAWVAEAAE